MCPGGQWLDLNTVDSSSCKHQSLVMIGLGPKHETNFLATFCWNASTIAGSENSFGEHVSLLLCL